MRTYAQLTTSFVVFCNRVGVDESISFWGGSEVIAPSGRALFSAPLYDEGLFVVDVALQDVRRERIALPLLRDERPELHVRELSRIIAERAGHGSRLDRRARRRARLRRGGTGRPCQPARSGPGPRRGRPVTDAAVRAAGRAGDRHRRRPPGHRRVHPRPAPPGRASSRRSSGCRAGSIRRSWPTSSPRPIGGGPAACRPACRTGRRRRRRGPMPRPSWRALGCSSELIEITAMVDGYFGADGARGCIAR